MLIVEDGTGITGAESYVSIAEADAYHLKMGNSQWPQPPSATPEDPAPVDLDLAKKESMLRRGAIYLDGTYRAQVNGIAKIKIQSLLFPRLYATYWDGTSIDANSVPQIYKDAQCEVALLAFTGAALAVTTTAGAGELKRKKIDVLEWEWFEGTSTTSPPVFGWIDLMLANLFGCPTDEQAMQIGRIART